MYRRCRLLRRASRILCGAVKRAKAHASCNAATAVAGSPGRRAAGPEWRSRGNFGDRRSGDLTTTTQRIIQPSNAGAVAQDFYLTFYWPLTFLYRNIEVH